MMKAMQRRGFLGLVLSGVSMLVLAKNGLAEMIKPISKSNADWKRLLTPPQYNVLREEGTEIPFTSPLLKEERGGIFACVACDLPLFPSRFKFDSGTGWPSFFDKLPGNPILTKTDISMFVTRTEYHCARCGGHQGHVFDDGPAPTGLRYCNNGVALKFIPDKA